MTINFPSINRADSPLPLMLPKSNRFPHELCCLILEQLSKYALHNMQCVNRQFKVFLSSDPLFIASLLEREDLFLSKSETLRMQRVAGRILKSLVVLPGVVGPGDINESIKSFNFLTKLSLYDTIWLPEIHQLTTLTELNIINCRFPLPPDIEKYETIELCLERMTHLQTLRIQQFKHIIKLNPPPNLKILVMLDDLIENVDCFTKCLNLQTLALSVDTDGYDDFFSQALTNLTYLQLLNNTPYFLNRIEHFPNLRELVTSFTSYDDISQITGLTNLTNLRTDMGDANDLTFLASMTGLKSLDLSSFAVNTPFYFLTALTNLEKLFLSPKAPFTQDIKFITQLTNLNTLEVFPLNLIYLPDIIKNTNLTTLGCSLDWFIKVDLYLTKLQNISTIICNSISGFDLLAQHTSLTHLIIRNTKGVDHIDWEPLWQLTQLQRLDVYKPLDPSLKDALLGLTNLTDLGVDVCDSHYFDQYYPLFGKILRAYKPII